LTAGNSVESLAASLGYPNSDPHGDPIPPAGGGAVTYDAVPLTAWPPGKPAQIAHVEDEPERFLRQIAGQGLKPGGIVQVVESTPEQVVIRQGLRECRIPPLVAANIHVIPVGCLPDDREPLLRLSDLKPGEVAEVVLLEAELRGFTRRRLLDLGLTPNTRVVAHLANAFGDPLAYRVRGATIALRKDQASRILVKKQGQPPVDDAVEARTA
jgi:DtxR family Mn-dependent transcriptional regulator